MDWTPLGSTGRNELISGDRVMPHLEIVARAAYQLVGGEAFPYRRNLERHVG